MLYYITNSNVPTMKAFGYPIVKMSSSFADHTPVTLVIPNKTNKNISEDVFSYYKVKNNFSIIRIPIIESYNISFLGDRLTFLIEKISFAFSLLLLKINKDDICYSRDILSLFILRMKTKNVFLEIHYLSRFDEFLIHWIKLAKKVIVITSFLKNELVSIGYKQEDIHIAPDAVDLELFQNINESKIDIRNELGLPQDKTIALYTGNLFPWKGVYTLIDSFNYIEKDILIVFVGGSEDTLKPFQEYCESKLYRKNIIILGHRKHSEIPKYLKIADILILPNSAKEHISKYNTSPLKLFEYMASGNPIVATDLPSLREVLNESNAYFVAPDDPISLGKGISYIINNRELYGKISKQALIDVKKFTWEIRSKNILEFINK